jgi:hypothetical protein
MDMFRHQSSILHTVPKLVQVHSITDDEVFQALATGGDILLPKAFLDLSFDGVIRWKLLPQRSFSVCLTCGIQRDPSPSTAMA